MSGTWGGLLSVSATWGLLLSLYFEGQKKMRARKVTAAVDGQYDRSRRERGGSSPYRFAHSSARSTARMNSTARNSRM